MNASCDLTKCLREYSVALPGVVETQVQDLPDQHSHPAWCGNVHGSPPWDTFCATKGIWLGIIPKALHLKCTQILIYYAMQDRWGKEF